MMIKQIIPNVSVTDAAGHEFYTELLGLEKAFDLGWIASFRSPANQAAQVSLGRRVSTRTHAVAVINTSRVST